MANIPEKLKLKLTLTKTRLSDSDTCQNCGTELQGPYCHYCGQPDKNFFRFFPALLREMLGDMLDLDSRLTRTLKPLLFQPGKLADDYMHGRRFRYTSPVRLYLFSSIIFFLLAGLITNTSIQEQLGQQSNGATVQETTTEITPAEPASSDNNKPTVDEPAKAATDTSNSSKKHGPIHINLEPDNNNENIIINLPLVPQRLNDWINKELEKSEAKGKAIEADPSIIVSSIFDMLPMSVFILLPVFALLLKLFYLFSSRYYTEHLIFALYNHSFVFVLATILMLFNSGIVWATNMNWITNGGWFNTLVNGISNLLLIWLLLYFWVALKRYYHQGWKMTSVKFITIGMFYTALLGALTIFVTLLSFLLL